MIGPKGIKHDMRLSGRTLEDFLKRHLVLPREVVVNRRVRPCPEVHTDCLTYCFRGPNSVTLFDILPQTHFLTGWTGLEAGTQKREVIESSEA